MEDATALEDRTKKRDLIVKRQGADAIADPALLGPSVRHVDTVLLPGTLAAVKTIQAGKGHERQQGFDSLDDLNHADVWHMVHSFAKPRSADAVCPRDQDRGSTHVDTLRGLDHVGMATALLSCSWGHRILDVSEALQTWAESSGRDLKRTYIWMCSLCMNQHDFERRLLQQGAAKGPGALQKEFGNRVVAIGRMLPMLAPWNDPEHVKRAWCLFELCAAIRKPEQVQVDIILPPTQHTAFRDAINAQGCGVVDAPLDVIDAASATTSDSADLESIRSLVRGCAGGFDSLNETLRTHLKRWSVTAGGIRVTAARALGTRRSRIVSSSSVAGSIGFDAGAADTLWAMPTRQRSEMDSLDDVAVGNRVVVDGRAGVVRHVGAVHAHGTRQNSEVRAGIELDRPERDHNGTVDGTLYFQCGERRGIFATIAQIRLLAPAWAGDATRGADPRQTRAAAGHQGAGPNAGGSGLSPVRAACQTNVITRTLAGSNVSHVFDGDDGGYMAVEGTATPLNQLRSDDLLITDTGFAVSRQESDVLLVAEIGPERSIGVASAPPRARRESMPLWQTTALQRSEHEQQEDANATHTHTYTRMHTRVQTPSWAPLRVILVSRRISS